MLVSGGKILAIDHVITDGVTITGDGTTTKLTVIGGGTGGSGKIKADNGISAKLIDDEWNIGLSANPGIPKVNTDATLTGDGTEQSALGVNMTNFDVRAPLAISADENNVSHLYFDGSTQIAQLEQISAYLNTNINTVSGDVVELKKNIANLNSYVSVPLNSDNLPDVEESKRSHSAMYLTPDPDNPSANRKIVWIWNANNVWEKIGVTDVDLQGYVSKQEFDTSATSYDTTIKLYIADAISAIDLVKLDKSEFATYSAAIATDISTLSAEFDNYLRQEPNLEFVPELGTIVQYIGEDTSEYKNGLIYKYSSELVIDDISYMPLRVNDGTTTSKVYYASAPSPDRIQIDDIVFSIQDHTAIDSGYRVLTEPVKRVMYGTELWLVTASDGVSTIELYCDTADERVYTYHYSTGWHQIKFTDSDYAALSTRVDNLQTYTTTINATLTNAIYSAVDDIHNTSGYGYSAWSATSAYDLSKFVSGSYLSANALDNVSATWNEVSSISGYGYSAWSATSAFDITSDNDKISAYYDDSDNKWHISAAQTQNVLTPSNGISIENNIISVSGYGIMDYYADMSTSGAATYLVIENIV